MARTAQMRLMELMVLKQDISPVIEYIGKKESFQFQNNSANQKKILTLIQIFIPVYVMLP